MDVKNHEMEYLPFDDVDESGWEQRTKREEYLAAIGLAFLVVLLVLLAIAFGSAKAATCPNTLYQPSGNGYDVSCPSV